jgi:PAS domain S-box-containing protein
MLPANKIRFARGILARWIFILLLPLAAGSSFDLQAAPTVQKAPLIFLGDDDYPPMAFLENGVAKGMDVDFGRALAGRMNRDFKIELMDWGLAQEKVQKGGADGLLGMSISEERRKFYDFSEPVFTHEFGLLVRNGEVAINSVADLNGKNVGVTSGGFPRRFLEPQPGVKLVLITNYQDGFDRLMAGKIDAVAADLWVAAYLVEKGHIRSITIAGKPFATTQSAIAVRKGNAVLLAEINHAIETLDADGTIPQIRDKWRPQEMLFLSRGKLRLMVFWIAGCMLALLLGLMTSWIFTLKRQIGMRKQAEIALKESEQHFRMLTQAAFEGVAISEDGLILDANDQLLKMFGYEREEIIGKRIIDLVAPESRAIVAESIRSGTEEIYGHRVLRKDGSFFYCETKSKTVRVGELVLRMAALRDITGRKRVEKSLRESEEKFSKAFRTGPDVMSITDFEKNCYLEVNEAHEKTFGLKREEVIGRTPQELGVFQDAVVHERLHRELKEHGLVRGVEIEARTRDGRKLTLLHSAELIELGGRLCVLRVSHDITERKQAEELNRLQMQVLEMIAAGKPLNETLETLVRMVEAQSPEMLCSVLLLNADGIHIRHGAAPSLPPEYIKAIDGSSIGPCAGSCGTAAFRGEPVNVSDISSDPLWAEYRQFALPHGLRACWSTPIFDSQRKVLGTFAIYYRRPGLPDKNHLRLIEMATHTAAICITKQRAEAEREESIAREQQARIEYTLRLIATQEAERKRIATELHDGLGQNLTLIKNSAQMALRNAKSDEAREQVTGINQLAAQCIAEARQISRDLHPHQLDFLGLKRSLEAMLENIAQASEIKFTWKIDDTDKIFATDAAMSIYRIVQESLNNILKHSRAKNVDVRLERDVHEVLLRIADDGCGFNPGKLSANKNGFGLKNIAERVRMLDGKLTVDSAPGEGARVEITIPVPEGAA